jgi:hypothetical protein
MLALPPVSQCTATHAVHKIVMVQPEAGPAVPKQVPAQQRRDRYVEVDWRLQDKGGMYKVRFFHVRVYDPDNEFDVTCEQTAGWMQTYFNFLQVTSRLHAAARVNLARLDEKFHPPHHKEGVEGCPKSWIASGDPADDNGPQHNLSQGTDQRVNCLRLALRLYQRLYSVDANTLPPQTRKASPRKKSIIESGVFQSFLPAELVEMPYSTIYQVLEKIRNNKI